MTGEDNFDLERLRAELSRERQMNDAVEQSLSELRTTVDDLEKRMEGFDDESCEWKTRYETQVEMNEQLRIQVQVLTDKVEEAKQMLKDGKLPKTMRMFDNSAEVTPHFVRTLERSKQIFENQLRDLEWRLDQESKAYHKANEERKNYVMEVSATKGAFDYVRSRQRQNNELGDGSMETSRAGNVNIAQNQRVLDVKRGPIRKTAAVKTLPHLDSNR
jgi:chromosome segregation ATPase